MKLTEAELRELAKQLRCPDHHDGLQVAEMMNVTNANIISKAIASLNLQPQDALLEIGPGNGKHIEAILQIEDLKYFGTDTSEAMVAECNMRYSEINNATVSLTDGVSLPYPDGYFNKIFTVNTIYFWEDPHSYASEIYRVMKTGGVLGIAFIPEHIMLNIPFAKYGFTHYSKSQVKSLLLQSGFIIQNEITETELVKGNSGQQIQREFVIITASKG
jgi:ubiquinone/menaquinone biosynthesis C-methylase UbiE